MKPVHEKEVVFFEDGRGRRPFLTWLETLDSSTRRRIDQKILRLLLGNYGDCRVLKGGISELRFSFGAGYRIYFGEGGNRIVVLLNGGDKKTQSKDIKKAGEYWREYRENERG